MMLPVFSAPLRTGGFRAAINLVRHVASSSSSSSSSSSTNAVMAAAATAPAAAVSHESAAPSSSSSPSSATATMSFPELAATLRGTGHSGSRRSRQMRDHGRIPGVLYGLDDDRNVLKRMVSVDLKTIAAELRERKSSMENTIYRLRLDDGTTHLVTPRQLQVHPLLDIPIAVNFLKYRPGNRMRIPVDFVNADLSVDLRRGCFLTRVNRYVECICEHDVPSKLTIDLTGAEKGDVVRCGTISFPPGVRPSPTVPADYVIAVVKSSKSK